MDDDHTFICATCGKEYNQHLTCPHDNRVPALEERIERLERIIDAIT